MSLLARLKPYNERKGHRTRVYMIEGARFIVERGWYEVSEDFGAKLKKLHQDHYDEDSPFLFDVCTPSEAEKLEEAERKVVEVKATVRQPQKVVARSEARRLPAETGGDMTSADINPPAMLDPDPDGKELEEPEPDEGRAIEVGRVSPKSTPPTKPRTKRG